MGLKRPLNPNSDGDDSTFSPGQNQPSLLVAEDGTNKTRRLVVDELRNLFVKVRSISRLIWKKAADWNKGTVPATMEVNGTGEAAVLRLKEKSDSDNDIDYDTPGDYTLSDSGKVEVSGSQARLKAISGSTEDWPFTTPGNYLYDAGLLEVIGGVGQLKSQSPANATFYASYASDINGNWGDGVLTGTATGGAAVSAGFLDLAHDDIRYVSYVSADNFAGAQTGCIRFIVKPNYSGTPSTQEIFFDINNGTDNNNPIVV